VKSGLGADNMARETYDATAGSVAAGPPVKLLNAPVTETAAVPAEEPAPPAAPAKVAPPAKKVEPIKAETAKAEAPKAEAPKAEAPKAEKPAAKTADKPKPKAETVKAAAKTEPAKAAAVEPVAEKADALPERSNAPSDTAPTRVAALSPSNTAKEPKKAAAAPAKCRVFTASYGGSKSIIIKALADGVTNFTVLDVNDGSERREADAYIGAYAKRGEQVGDPQNQDKALEKAFELCPEG
jgi:hypothetical protein